MMFGYKTKANFTVENEAAISKPPSVDFAPPPAAPAALSEPALSIPRGRDRELARLGAGLALLLVARSPVRRWRCRR